MRAALMALAIAAAACTPPSATAPESEPPTAEEIATLEAAARDADIAATRAQIEDLERALAAETRNEDWARAQENMLRASLAQSGVAASQVQIDCRAQVCRAAVSESPSAPNTRAPPVPIEETGQRLIQTLGLAAGQCGFSLFGPLPEEESAPALRLFLDCRTPAPRTALE